MIVTRSEQASIREDEYVHRFVRGYQARILFLMSCANRGIERSAASGLPVC